MTQKDSASPAADMVLVPREPSYEQLARMSGAWCCSVEEMAESWAQMLDDLAAPASPSPVRDHVRAQLEKAKKHD